MLRHLFVLSLLAAPAAAVTATASPAPVPAQAEADGGWGLAAMPNGCMVQAVSPGGTMISIWGFAGQEKLAFLLQNRGWQSLRDGGSYDVRVDFVGVRSMPVEATARERIDADGPGLFFTVEPGGESGDGFLEAFSTAQGMRIVQDGRSVDTLPLAGGRGAMAALARCLADKWGGSPADAPALEGSEAAGVEI